MELHRGRGAVEGVPLEHRLGLGSRPRAGEDVPPARGGNLLQTVTVLFAAPTLGGNPLGLYDLLAFVAVAIAALGVLAFAVFLFGLPGRLAIARKHPEAEAVNLMGWAGFFALYPWFQALIWAFKPSDVVDIRRFPRAEAAAEREEQARLTGKALPDEKPPPVPGSPSVPPVGRSDKT